MNIRRIIKFERSLKAFISTKSLLIIGFIVAINVSFFSHTFTVMVKAEADKVTANNFITYYESLDTLTKPEVLSLIEHKSNLENSNNSVGYYKQATKTVVYISFLLTLFILVMIQVLCAILAFTSEKKEKLRLILENKKKDKSD